MNVLITIIVLQILTSARVGNGHGYDINDWRPLTPRPYRERPIDVIVDVVNDLGVKLLDCYMERPGNIAFSPAGLAFVLAALYEGSAGRSNRQIAHILGLPRDRRITRIGLRDIHRRLRSYLNADTFLGGLTLNRDDIILRPEYEDILRFYGFDFANMTDSNDTMMMENTTDITTITTNLGMITTINSDDLMMTTMPPSTTIGAALIAATTTSTTTTTTTTTAAAAKTTTITDATTIATPDNVDIDVTNVTSSPMTTTFQSPQTDTTTFVATTPTVNPLAEMIPLAVTTDSASVVANMMDSSSSPITTPNPTTQIVDIITITTPNTNDSLPLDTTIENIIDLNNSTSLMDTTIGSIVNTNNDTSSVDTRMASTINTNNDTSSLDTTIGSIIDTNNGSDDNQTRLMTSAVSSNSNDDTQTIIPTVASVTIENPSNQSTTVPTLSRDDNNVRKRRSIKSRRSFPIYQEKPVWIDDLIGWQDYPSTFDDDITGTLDQGKTQLNFFIHGCDVSTISTITYTAILPFAYFPALRALALEFPLDDPRYNVIVLIPAEGNDSRTLNRLLATKTLRKLRQSLRPTWVRTTVPSFTLRGFITLTPYLQQLGIKDAFEPRSADLSPMSPDLGVYARDVQQSIGVNIRNFMKNTNDSLPTMSATENTYVSPGNARHTTRTPLPFTANRPFLFFIVDNETSIALIAGRVDDPLNSRIN